MPFVSHRSFTILSALSLLLCVAVLWPRYGPPEFRYTGSDPQHHVWNLAVPAAVFIYDPLSGFHVGPLLSLVLFAYVFALALFYIVVGGRDMINRLRRRRLL